MSLWGRYVTPRLVEMGSDDPREQRIRELVCDGLAGVVVELGFGSGLNVPHYPAAVTQVLAVEPSDLAWRLAADRVAGSSTDIVRSGLDGQRLDLPGASVDTALSTFTLCTIPDAEQALREVGRVLRPGGTLHFVEHGWAPDADMQRWQRRLEPIQKRVFDGCHLTRRIDELVEASGFEIVALDRTYADLPAPRPFRYTYAGRARVAAI